MPIAPGTRLGHYQIEAALGSGGMGEVYRARDTRIDRTVAIKVLPSHLAESEDMKSRFDREARAISSLNHPNICALYDVGQESGTHYLVMEYLEGQELSKVLEKGPMPASEVLKIAVPIADALDKAHRQGLVHRDLKPGNIVLTKNGAKLLDFGLAKWQATSENQALSGLTRTTSPLTGEGTIVGTFQYMSPEQLEGREVDARSDLFSLGVVLYEMISGKRPFEGKSQASLIASIMREDPRPLSALQPLTPPALERVVKQCLAKDPDDRWQSAGDLKRELSWIVEGGSQVGVPAAVSAGRRRRVHLGWAFATVSGLAALLMAALLWLRPATPLETVRMEIPAWPALRSMAWPMISPDGKTLAFRATDTLGKTQIWTRPMSSLTAQAIAGTEGAGRPFWSPDSRFLAFIMNGQLKKVAAAGGPVQLVGEATAKSDGTWGREGIILLDGNATDSIEQISVNGGFISAATSMDRAAGETYHAWPCFLPDGKHFLFLAAKDSTATQSAGLFTVKVGSLGSRESKALFLTASRIAYDPTGHVLYVMNGVLMAMPFDADRLETTGEPRPVAENMFRGIGTAGGPRSGFSVSDLGTLIYQTQGGAELSELVWVDRTGKELSKVGPPGAYRDLMLSPDGTRLAYAQVDAQLATEDIWIRDLARDVSSRLTFDPKDDIWPVWSPDGQQVAFASNRSGLFAVYRKASNGTSEEVRLSPTDTQHPTGPSAWFRNPSRLLYQKNISGSWDWGIYDVETGVATPVATSSFNELCPAASPDGRFVAYTSGESGRFEIYITELGAGRGKWQVSNNIGGFPTWRADGRELFFHGPFGVMMAVPITPGPTLQVGSPVELFDLQFAPDGIRQRRYDVTADGQRFILNRRIGTNDPVGFVVVMNWTAELERDER